MVIANISVEDLPEDKQKAIRQAQINDIREQLKDSSISAAKRKKLKGQLKALS